MARRDSGILVIGVGNELRGDDAAGLLAVRRLAAMGLDGVVFEEHGGEGTELIEAWRDADSVFIIDAARAGSETGTVYRFDAAGEPLPRRLFRRSTHDFGVAEAVELARELGRLPPRLVVFAIEGESFRHGTALSPGVDRALAELERTAASEIRAVRGRMTAKEKRC